MLFQNTTMRTPAMANVADDELRQLPQFFRGSLDYVYRMGGPLYRRILNAAPLQNNRRHISIDSRVHMLMPGWWPCIPGWHCDDFYRPNNGRPNDGQPDLRGIARDPSLNSMHHGLVLGSVAPTEFLDEPIELDDEVLDAPVVSAACHAEIERLKPRTTFAKPGEFISFDALVLHRGVQAKKAGWRLFVRITESDHYEPLNEIRTQTQVYLSDAGAGW